MFDSDYVRRYGRQISLPEIGADGQRKLSRAKVLLVGAGGLGSPASLYLAGAGVGELGLADPDFVELSNLHRQILHGEKDLGASKIDSALESLAALNSSIVLKGFREKLTRENFGEVAKGYDLIIEGSDNFPTKFAVNDACVEHGKKLILGGLLKFDGQILTVVPPDSSCYRCCFSEEPAAGVVPNCAEGGLVGAVAGALGCLMACEAIKLIAGMPLSHLNRLTLFNFGETTVAKQRVKPRPDCFCRRFASNRPSF